MEQNQHITNTALLVMDVQGATAGRLAEPAAYFNKVNQVIQSARENKIPVIYVVFRFREGFPELNPENKFFADLRSRMENVDPEKAFSVYPSVAPLPGELVITKKRASAFTGSDLEVVLRSFGIKRLVLFGISTSGVVLSTVREAADKDYQMTVISDCCFDMDEEVHRVLTTKVFPRQADVVTSEEWTAGVQESE